MKRGGCAQGGARPRKEIYTGSHRRNARKDAAIDAQFVVDRQEGRDGNEKGHCSGAVEMHEQCE